MREKSKFYLIGIASAIFLFWGICGVSLSYAEEQRIAESFGLYSKGKKYYHTGKLHEAKKILEKALELDPRNGDAKIYLDIVNAELRLRARGELGYYEKEGELRRESDLEEEDQFYEELEEEIEEEEAEYEYSSMREIEPEEPEYPQDKIKAVADEVNEEIFPSEIRGEYKMALGVTTEDLIWKKANGDYNERNFRMIDETFPKMNTFDTRVYDRFKVVFDTNDEEGLNFHSDITVDPWSFVGKTKKVTISDNEGADKTEIELKYWSNNRSTINETIPTLLQGDSIALPEIKVIDGKTTAVRVTDTYDQIFAIPVLEIEESFQPVREMWFDYKVDNYKFRVFPFGLEDQALSSDDPLGLSNHHIYWEPSPWLDDWKPGNFNSASLPSASFASGEWSDDLSFFTRDSELKRLTALRGFSFQGDFFDNTDLSMMLATPKTLWQDYDSVTALPAALRTKTWINDELMVGFVDTFRMGYNENKADSYNNVFGVDASYDFDPATNIVAEVSMSKSEDDRSSSYKTEKNGTAAHIGIKKQTSLGNAKLAVTHMDEAFDPGLANYRETRKDAPWGRHIHFKKPLEQTAWGATSLKYEDIEPFRIGDGIDIGRNAINFRLDTKDALDGAADNLIDYRYVRDANHKYVEGVFREENTYRVNPEWTSKFLMIYHDLPKTKAGIDPIKYDSDTGEYLAVTDNAIKDGTDPSVSTYSVGLEYVPEDWISVFGIYENTNDYRFSTGNHPNGLLNDTYVVTETIEGRQYRKEMPRLYSQGFFDLPPYERFNIYRLGVSLQPSEILGIDFDYTKNDFKFAGGIDDNINHFGTTLRYKFSPRLTGFLKYTFSRSYNLYRLNTSGDLKYENHNNVFMEFDYNVSEYGLLVIQFGEGSVVSPLWGATGGATASPFGDFYPTLDTQHILRVYYNGKF